MKTFVGVASCRLGVVMSRSRGTLDFIAQVIWRESSPCLHFIGWGIALDLYACVYKCALALWRHGMAYARAHDHEIIWRKAYLPYIAQDKLSVGPRRSTVKRRLAWSFRLSGIGLRVV